MLLRVLRLLAIWILLFGTPVATWFLLLGGPTSGLVPEQAVAIGQLCVLIAMLCAWLTARWVPGKRPQGTKPARSDLYVDTALFGFATALAWLGLLVYFCSGRYFWTYLAVSAPGVLVLVLAVLALALKRR
jgi:hypothetical protein